MTPNGKNVELYKKGLTAVEHVGLICIAIATVIAGGTEIWTMVENAKVTLADLLLLFLYLEVLAMVTVYFESGQLPVRFPLYIGMIALARYLILDMKEMEDWRIVAVAAAILVLAFAVLIVRYGHCRFPYEGAETRHRKANEEAARRDVPPG